MPLLAAREGDNDGGYAVVDYDAVDPRLGTMDDLEGLAGDLHARGMSCASTSCSTTPPLSTRGPGPRRPVTRRTAATTSSSPTASCLTGTSGRCRRCSPTRLPAASPTSEGVGWVWTTFNTFQWDLDWTNPAVFAEMLATMLRLANHGVDVLRLDAAPFLWKREGTDCQNQPEVHLVLQAMRGLVTVGTPRCGVQGRGDRRTASSWCRTWAGTTTSGRSATWPTTTSSWSCCGRPSRRATCGWPARPCRGCGRHRASTAWVTYLRCHDDIGWAVSDEDARAVGLDPHAHRTFLSDFYAGLHPGSFARGAVFQANPRTGDRRISGSAASLVGLQAALADGDDLQTQIAVDRLLMLYAAGLRLRRRPTALHGRRARPAQRPAVRRTTRRTPATTGGCTGLRWTGLPLTAVPTRRRSPAGCSPACGSSGAPAPV